VLDDLISRYGTGAVVSVRPYMPDNSGAILRWVLDIDGEPVEDLDVRTYTDERFHVAELVRGSESLELGRASLAQYPDGPAAYQDTLGGLQRRGEHGR
jgi:hypothetical protein